MTPLRQRLAMAILQKRQEHSDLDRGWQHCSCAQRERREPYNPTRGAAHGAAQQMVCQWAQELAREVLREAT